jgi:hypothetical protein
MNVWLIDGWMLNAATAVPWLTESRASGARAGWVFYKLTASMPGRCNGSKHSGSSGKLLPLPWGDPELQASPTTARAGAAPWSTLAGLAVGTQLTKLEHGRLSPGENSRMLTSRQFATAIAIRIQNTTQRHTTHSTQREVAASTQGLAQLDILTSYTAGNQSPLNSVPSSAGASSTPSSRSQSINDFLINLDQARLDSTSLSALPSTAHLHDWKVC